MVQLAEELDDLEDEIDELEDEEESTEELDDLEDEIADDADDDLEDETDDDADDEIEIQIGGESPPSDEEDDKTAPSWVRDLRKKHRESQRENRELKAKLETVTGSKKPVDLGKKPTLEDCEYDTDVYDTSLSTWYENKRKYDDEQLKVEANQNKAQEDWNNTLSEYSKKKANLKVKDFDEAEAVVQDNFNSTQQGMVIQGADDAAMVFYALGKNPKKLQELSSIQDPVKFAFAVAKLETQLKIVNRKAGTKPEKKVVGGGRAPNSSKVNSTLKRLREEASKTGNFSKVTAYRRKIKANSK